MIPALILVSLDNCRILECTVFLTPCAFIKIRDYQIFRKEKYLDLFRKRAKYLELSKIVPIFASDNKQ